jgi:hypothetical protein
MPRMLSYPIDPIVVAYLTVPPSARDRHRIGPELRPRRQFVPVEVIAISFSIAGIPDLAETWNADGPAFRQLVATTSPRSAS